MRVLSGSARREGSASAAGTPGGGGGGGGHFSGSGGAAAAAPRRSRDGPGAPGEPATNAASTTAPLGVVHKLLNANMELSTDELHKVLGDTADFTVIGVLGQQGVGKSTIMSLIAGATWREDSEENELLNPPFAPQSAETLLNAGHQTMGVDVRVTPERLVLLDAQPLQSPSILQELLRREPQVHGAPGGRRKWDGQVGGAGGIGRWEGQVGEADGRGRWEGLVGGAGGRGKWELPSCTRSHSHSTPHRVMPNKEGSPCSLTDGSLATFLIWQLPTEAHSYENLLELHSLRLSMLMLTVCHHVM